MGMVLWMWFVYDYQLDVKFKCLWFFQLYLDDCVRFVVVFDDWKLVVDMWWVEGVFCFQVVLGDF